MPSSDPAGTSAALPAGPVLAAGGRGRALLWGVVVVNATLGLGLLLVAGDQLATPAPDRAWSVPASVAVAVGALAWLGVGTLGFWLTYLRRPSWDPDRAFLGDTEHGPAVVLPWRTAFLRRPVVLSALVMVLLAGLAVVLGSAGNAGWWVPAAAALLVLVVVPQAVVRARRPGRLVLAPQGIGVTGPDGDAWLDWDDLRGIGVVDVGWWGVLRVVGTDPAPSWRYRPRRTASRATTPAGPWVEIPGPAVPVDPAALIRAIARYRQDPAARAELATDQGRRRVAGLD
ncbi:hypothetical protein [Actinotalea fermentans]|uniref:Uncharacterized protein n=1 Tax=Actinotalea fermentans TaxID=43671 RepID=A0A511YSY6_9CELL|nr:hypothetical protein [Actinotalea fermentans]GEN78303.1 hypothetical protein AFE02nite_00370 [Actinotalea fermentans]